MKKSELFKRKVFSCFSETDTNHVFSIILRAYYEYEQMHNFGKLTSFNISQMDDFNIKFNMNYFELNFKEEFCDITIPELKEIVDMIYEYFSDKYPIKFDFKLINPVYFSLFFYDLLDKIIYIKEDVINIKDIRLLRYRNGSVPIEESERYKALINRNYKMYSPFKSNLVIDTPVERLRKILLSVKKNGYGYNGEYAIFYNNEPFIRDGQHRVAVTKYLYGNIDIKIIRFYLKNNYFYE